MFQRSVCSSCLVESGILNALTRCDPLLGRIIELRDLACNCLIGDRRIFIIDIRCKCNSK